SAPPQAEQNTNRGKSRSVHNRGPPSARPPPCSKDVDGILQHQSACPAADTAAGHARCWSPGKWLLPRQESPITQLPPATLIERGETVSERVLPNEQWRTRWRRSAEAAALQPALPRSSVPDEEIR